MEENDKHLKSILFNVIREFFDDYEGNIQINSALEVNDTRACFFILSKNMTLMYEKTDGEIEVTIPLDDGRKYFSDHIRLAMDDSAHIRLLKSEDESMCLASFQIVKEYALSFVGLEMTAYEISLCNDILDFLTKSHQEYLEAKSY